VAIARVAGIGHQDLLVAIDQQGQGQQQRRRRSRRDHDALRRDRNAVVLVVMARDRGA
jgi:hypothetical protein